jgi:hypothetical protein
VEHRLMIRKYRMLLVSALTLAHELGVSDQRLQSKDPLPQTYTNEAHKRAAEFQESRLRRPRRLLYTFINQLASRLEWSSMIPRIISDDAVGFFFVTTERRNGITLFPNGYRSLG